MKLLSKMTIIIIFKKGYEMVCFIKISIKQELFSLNPTKNITINFNSDIKIIFTIKDSVYERNR